MGNDLLQINTSGGFPLLATAKSIFSAAILSGLGALFVLTGCAARAYHFKVVDAVSHDPVSGVRVEVHRRLSRDLIFDTFHSDLTKVMGETDAVGVIDIVDEIQNGDKVTFFRPWYKTTTIKIEGRNIEWLEEIRTDQEDQEQFNIAAMFYYAATRKYAVIKRQAVHGEDAVIVEMEDGDQADRLIGILSSQAIGR